MKMMEMTETEALLKILELGEQQIRDGKCHPADEVLRDVLMEINKVEFSAPVSLRKAS